MDGRVSCIRRALDGDGFTETAILLVHGEVRVLVLRPFREAADCARQFGDRAGYQMDRPAAGAQGRGSTRRRARTS